MVWYVDLFMFQSNQSESKPYACAAKEVQRKQCLYTCNLKVYYVYQSGNFHKPFIGLSGNWLKDAGFAVGDKICVMVKDSQLIIEPAK
jgi:hypothetical protein